MKKLTLDINERQEQEDYQGKESYRLGMVVRAIIYLPVITLQAVEDSLDYIVRFYLRERKKDHLLTMERGWSDGSSVRNTLLFQRT